jgi:hypothetical protein
MLHGCCELAARSQGRLVNLGVLGSLFEKLDFNLNRFLN